MAGKDEIRSSGKEDTNAFDERWDSETRRVSFKDGFLDHYKENLGFIVGVLDMIFQLADAEKLRDIDRNGFVWVVLDAKNKTDELRNNL